MPPSTQKVGSGTTCPVCKSADLHPFFEQTDVPVVCNQLLASPEDARAVSLGDVSLAYCASCGSIANYAFDPEKMDYDASYDNALHFSGEFQKFANALAARLVKDHSLNGKRVAEIGCGDGYFLRLLLEHGVGSAVGYDPSMSDGRADKLPQQDALTILPVAFGDQQLPDDIEAVVCRHVLEHIPDPISFLSAIRKTIGNRPCVMYFEVPNAKWLLESDSIWDVIYEHVTYWTPPALSHALRRAGFTPTNVQTGFNDQFLQIEAWPANDTDTDTSPFAGALEETRQAMLSFEASAARELGDWQKRLSDLHANGGTAALWGAGSKGVTFLNVVPAAADAITCVVDVNTRKHGMYVAGTAHPIVPPDRLVEAKPNLIIVANEIYLNEIRAMVEAMGLTPEFAVIVG